MKQWEYLVVEIPNEYLGRLDPWYSKVQPAEAKRRRDEVAKPRREWWNDLGNQGWELVEVHSNGVAYFKREKP